MKIPSLFVKASMAFGPLFAFMAEAVPGNIRHRDPNTYQINGESYIEPPKTPVLYEYGFVTTTTTIVVPSPTSNNWGPHISNYVPTCSDWVLCYSCAGGYSCPTTDIEVTPTYSSLVIVPTCPSWKACPQCRGGYKCWKSRTTSVDPYLEAPSEVIVVPTCSPWEYCYTCIGGYTCPLTLSSTATPIIGKHRYLPQSPDTPEYTPTTTTYDWASYEQPSCTDYIVCPECSLGYYCPTSSFISPKAYYGITTDPVSTHQASSVSYYPPPPCDDYVVCPACFLGYYCPKSELSATPTVYLPPQSTLVSPTCDDYILCPTCPLGYYCRGEVVTTPTSNYDWTSYEQPTCEDYIICPSCSLGYYCPTSEAPRSPIYYTSSIEEGATEGYLPSTLNPYVPSTTYYLDYSSTTLIVAPTCSDYILCPICPSGYYCPESPKSLELSADPKYYTSASSGISEPTVTPCDIYIFCPECELGYSCLNPAVTSTGASYQTYATANPQLVNYPTPRPYSFETTPNVDIYASTIDDVVYESRTVPAPEFPTCAGYILCPTCPSGYYCTSTISPHLASSKQYGNVPTGIIESVYSTRTVLPTYYLPDICSNEAQTVTITKTKNMFHIYNTCGSDPYAALATFVLPTITVTQCDPVYPVTPSNYEPSFTMTSESLECITCTTNNNIYTVSRDMDVGSVSLINWGQGTKSKEASQYASPPFDVSIETTTSTSCAWKPCEGGYYCETCPHKWYCPTSSVVPSVEAPYIPYA